MEDSSGRPAGRAPSRAARTDTEMQESEDRFRAFVTATSEMVYRFNGDWSELLELEGDARLPDADLPRSDWLE
ncbi:MAG: histidine kinase, partial [Verrucomicrobiaceae bacterium]